MCGILAVVGLPDAARVCALGLHALQHRGQESAGIASSDGREVYLQRAMGHALQVFDEQTLSMLPGRSAIGHVRYSTTGASRLRNAQPLCLDTADSALAIAHNGNLVNALPLRRELAQSGALFSSGTDTEVVQHLVARAPGRDLAERLRNVMVRLEGAYSLALCTPTEVVVARDPRGYRPLVLGTKVTAGGVAWLAASETAALALCGAEFVREVEPGEVVGLDAAGLRSLSFAGTLPPRRACVFEHVYFARPDSVVFGESVYDVRKRLGMQLARECPAPSADVVVPVPDSGVSAALGFARQSGIQYELGLIRSHYVGRTFIQPSPALREVGVRRKLSPVRHVIAGKSLVVVDDSVVRGTTSRQILALLREAGARELHLRISSPPVAWPCWYGIDTPDRDQLLAAGRSHDAIAAFLGCDTIGYLSPAGLEAAAGEGGWCTACFTGSYPEPLRG
jgi:amidophosphoribosyltransferase